MRSHVFFLFLVMITTGTAMTAQQSIDEFRWENRIIVVSGSDQVAVASQIEELSQDTAGLKERKLLILKSTSKGQVDALAPSKMYTISKSLMSRIDLSKPLQVLLIGLDGGVKEIFTERVDIHKIYTIIDGMPMRRSEIRRSNE